MGRRNRYLVRRQDWFRHSLEAGVTVGAFIDRVARLTECDRWASARAGSFARRPSLDIGRTISHIPPSPATAAAAHRQIEAELEREGLSRSCATLGSALAGLELCPNFDEVSAFAREF